MAIMDLFTSLQTIINERSAKKVRQSIHDGIFRANQVVDENKDLVDQVAIRQDAVEQYNDQMIAEMTDKDVISAPELIESRDGEVKLSARLDRDKNQLATQLAQMVVNVKSFGAVGDGVVDDGPAIRSAYNALKGLGGGVLYFPEPSNYYSIQSTIDSVGFQVGIELDYSNIIFKGASIRTTVRADVEMYALIFTPITLNYISFSHINIHGGNKAQYGYKTNDVYVPYMNVYGSVFQNTLDTAFYANTYVSSFIGSHFSRSKTGWHVRGVGDNIATSITVSSCYANNNSEVGYKGNNLMYSSFNACAVDNTPLAYNLNGRGISMNGCGAELVDRILISDSFRGFSINGFYGFGVGSINPATPTEYLFEFVAGRNATISGLEINNANINRYYNKKLGLTSSVYGFENLTVLDNSVTRNEIFFVPNFNFATRPIKLSRGDETQKNQTHELHASELIKFIDSLKFMNIQHDITVKLTGAQENTVSATQISQLNGMGRVTIEGDALDREAVRLKGSWRKLVIRDNTALIILKNLTIEGGDPGGEGFDLISVENSRVILDNVLLDGSIMNTGTAVRASKFAQVALQNNTTTKGSFLAEKYIFDTSSVIKGTE